MEGQKNLSKEPLSLEEFFYWMSELWKVKGTDSSNIKVEQMIEIFSWDLNPDDYDYLA